MEHKNPAWKNAEAFQAALLEREYGQADRTEGTLEFAFATAVQTLDSNAGERTVTLRYRFPASMRNAWGHAHGGAEAMIADHAMAAVIRNQLDHDLTPTVALQMNYLKTAFIDRPFTVRVQLDHIGAHLVTASARAWSGDDPEPCATATATYVLKRNDKERPYGELHDQ